MKRKPLPPPPPSLSSTPPPVSSKEQNRFALNINGEPIQNSELESRLPSKSESVSRASSLNLNTEPQEQDPFFIAAKNFIIKKLELEELTKELQLTEYEQMLNTSKYTHLKNIYKKESEKSTIPNTSSVYIEGIRKSIKDKKDELRITQQEYETKKGENLELNELDKKIRLFDDTLNSYFDNKEKLMGLKTEIDKKMKEAITIRDKLTIIIKNDRSKTIHYTEEQEIKVIKDDWVPNYKSYVDLHTETFKLFDIDSFLDENTRIYSNLKELHLFSYINQELFNKVIYITSELLSIFMRLKNNVSNILKDYSSFNEHCMLKLDESTTKSDNPTRPKSKYNGNRNRVIQLYLQDIHRLEDANKELRFALEQSTDIRVKELTEKLEQTERELNELKQIQENPYEEKQRMVELNQKLSESEKEIARLKNENESLTGNEEPNENALIMEKMTEYQENLRREIERLKGLLNAKPEELTQQIETKQEELKVQQETNEFLLLAINAADLYEKEGFKKSFDDLLNYQPDDNFMFKYVFSQIEQEQEKGKYEYLDEFLRYPVKMPYQIYNDQLIPQIKGTLAFRPILQTH